MDLTSFNTTCMLIYLYVNGPVQNKHCAVSAALIHGPEYGTVGSRTENRPHGTALSAKAGYKNFWMSYHWKRKKT